MPEPPTYECIVCKRTATEPLAMGECSHCEQSCCKGCLPDHETRCLKDLKALEALQST